MNELTPEWFFTKYCKSAVAIKKGLGNSLPVSLRVNASLFFQHIYFPLETKFPGKFVLTSGYRCPSLNKLIGGSPTSGHCFAQAGDFEAIAGLSNHELFQFVRECLDFDQLIWEFGDVNNPDWVHVSYRSSGNRHNVLISYRHSGKSIYQKLASK